MDTMQMQCEMYERMLVMKDQEINRLWELLRLQKTGSTQRQRETPKIDGILFEVVEKNMSHLDENDIRKHLSIPAPA